MIRACPKILAPCLGAFLLAAASPSPGADLAPLALRQLEAPRGLCAVVGGGADLPMALAAGSELVILAQLSDRDEVAKLRRAADERGWLNRRVYAEVASGGTCYLAENSVDLLVAPDGGVSAAEVRRALAPLGRAVLRGIAPADLPGATREGDAVVWTKPFPEEMGQWSHWYHAPDNNPVSPDRALRWPFHLRWLGKPYFGAQPRTTLVHRGVLYSATGMADGGHSAVAEMILDACSLEARRAFNGEVLWRRKLPRSYYTSRSAFAATDAAFHMIDDGKGVLAFDPMTGRELRTLSAQGVPPNFKWIAVEGGVLFVLAGDPDPSPESTGFNLLYKYPAPNLLYEEGRMKTFWGYGTHLAAIDLRGGQTLWSYAAPAPLSARLLGMRDGRLYFGGFELGIGCLETATGKLAWLNDGDQLKRALQDYAKDARWHVLGTTRPALLATPEAAVVQVKELGSAFAVSATDGRLLWLVADASRRGLGHPYWLDGELRGLGGVFDLRTGEKSSETFPGGDGCGPVTVSAHGCYRRHSIFWDRARGKPVDDHTFRSGCWQDAIPAHGLLFNTPYVCGCNYSLQGLIVQGPADDRASGAGAAEPPRPERGTAEAGALAPDARDWPTYRANNHRTASAPVDVPESGVAERWNQRLPGKPTLTAPVAAGGLVFFAGDDGRVICLDAKTGGPKWQYLTGGKIFFPPSVADGRVYVSSADGYAYCLDAGRGGLLWRFRCAPRERRIMAYGLLSSTWPANTGVLVEEGVAYVGAGITSQGGTHLYALDAKTGEVRWRNDSSGQLDPEDLAGAAAQGCLTVAGGHLYLAGGNAASPVAYALASGSHAAPGHVAAAYSAKWQHSRGNEVANFRDSYIVTGGRILFSEQPRRDVKAGLETAFVPFDPASGKPLSPEIIPTAGRQTLPSWDDREIFLPAGARDMIECWDAPATLEFLRGQSAKFDPAKTPKGAKPVFELLGERRRVLATEFPMKRWGPLEITADAMALGANALVAVHQPSPGGVTKSRERPRKKGVDPSAEETPALPSGEWRLGAYSRADGKLLWEIPLASEPIDGGLCLDREGNAVVTFLDGSIRCFGRP